MIKKDNNYINKGDYIWELNNYTFNKMGFIYLPEINSSVHINTFMLLKGTNNITLKYTSHIYTDKLSQNINVVIPVKTIKIKIDFLYYFIFSFILILILIFTF